MSKMWQVVGQTRAVSLLQSSLEREALAHAYLFIGPPHVGKMTLALNLAQALNCEAAERPCGECESCQKIALGKHADVQIIGLTTGTNSNDAKLRTEIGIDQIREAQHSSNLPPYEGKNKVFIINGVEQLSSEAANCLLKTLEEPVNNVTFILLTASERLLPATVVSRCQRLELLPPPAGELEAALNNRWGIEPQQAKLVARLSHGCLGWALSAATGSNLLQQRTDRINQMIDTMNVGYEERFAYASQLAVQFSQSQETVQDILNSWLDWWHDLLLIKIGGNDNITNIDFEDKFINYANHYSLAQVKTVINGIQAAGRQLKQNANPRLVLEVLMLNIPVEKVDARNPF